MHRSQVTVQQGDLRVETKISTINQKKTVWKHKYNTCRKSEFIQQVARLKGHPQVVLTTSNLMRNHISIDKYIKQMNGNESVIP